MEIDLFKINDSVVVRSGVEDPDFKIDIVEWQGRIVKGFDFSLVITFKVLRIA